MHAWRRKPSSGEVKVSIRHDRLEAYLLFPSTLSRGVLKVRGLARLLRARGVVHGIDRAALREIARLAREGRLSAEALVARGDPGEPGRPARLELAVPASVRGRPRPVRRGETVLRVLPPRPPRPGRGVDGRPIRPPASLAAPEVVAGEGLVLAPEGDRYLATREGYLRTRDGRVEVTSDLDHEGDLEPGEPLRLAGCAEIRGSLRPGVDLVVAGSLRIAGEVGEGARVRAGGAIRVGGHVRQEARVEGERVAVRGTVATGPKGAVRARGALQVGSALDAVLEAGGDVEVEGSIERSTARAGGRFRCAGPDGRILRSRIEAVEGIEARFVGRPRAGGRSVLVAGITLSVDREIRAIEDDIRRLERYREHLYATFADRFRDLVRDPAAVARIPCEEREAFARAREEVGREQEGVDARISALRGEARELAAKRQVRRDAVIRVEGAAYPPADFFLRNQRLALRDEPTRAVVVAEGRALRPVMVPLADYDRHGGVPPEPPRPPRGARRPAHPPPRTRKAELLAGLRRLIEDRNARRA